MQSKFLFFLILSTLVLSSCTSDAASAPQKQEEEQSGNTPGNENDPADYTDIGPVAPDGVLESVTWNLEWYGAPGYGPEDERLQTKNILTVLDAIGADLYAFEEVENAHALNRLVDNMIGYKGVIAKDMVRDQKTAFVYNTKVIDPIASGLVKNGQDYYDWASGRFPFYFKFNYHTDQKTYTFFAVVIHAKCCSDEESYYRRKNAAQDLYNFLTQKKPNANIILLGDYNDDMDESIYNGWDSPYAPFLNATQSYKVVTQAITQKHIGTTVKYEDAVDHIMISNELFDAYIPKSAKVMRDAAGLIENYGATTSDHYPVGAEFDL